MSNANTWDRWIDAVRSGDAAATQDFWDRYGGPLFRLADRNLKQKLRRRVDPEDVVQSAFRTVLRRIQDGQFTLDDDAQMWRLLCAVTLNKSRRLARRHYQQRRSVEREAYFDSGTNDAPLPLCSDEPTPDEAVILVDVLEQLVNSADDEEQQVLLLKLEDMSNEQVAVKLRCSERTVRRILDRLRERLLRLLEL